MINELDLLCLPKFIGNIFIFGFKFSWNKGIDICFNVEFTLLGRNFYFLGVYLVVTARYLMVTACYRSLLVVPIFSMNVAKVVIHFKEQISKLNLLAANPLRH